MWRGFKIAGVVLGMSILTAAGMASAQAQSAARRPNPPRTVCIGSNCVSSPTANTGKIKWNPGHYMASGGIVYPGNQLSNFSAEMDDLNGWDQILGYRLFVTWGALEPSEGNYDFSLLDAIFNRLKTRYNKPKRLVLVVLPGTFANPLKSNHDGGSIPLYIQQDSKYGPSPVAGSYGWWGINSGGQSTGSYVAALFRPAVMDRFKALIQAIGARYDNDPYFEGWMVQENSWMIGSWLGAPDYDKSGMAPFPELLQASIAAFPHTNVSLQNTWLASKDATIKLSDFMFANRVLTASSDTVGQSAFDNYGYLPRLAWGIQSYAGVATDNFTPMDQRPTTHAMMDIESAEMTGNYFKKYGGPFTPLDMVKALNQTYGASHAFWTHMFGSEYHGTVPAESKWVNLAKTVSANPLTSTSYPANYPK